MQLGIQGIILQHNMRIKQVAWQNNKILLHIYYQWVYCRTQNTYCHHCSVIVYDNPWQTEERFKVCNTRSQLSYRRIIANRSIGAAILFSWQLYIGTHYRSSLIQCNWYDRLWLVWYRKLQHPSTTPNHPIIIIGLVYSTCTVLIIMHKLVL